MRSQQFLYFLLALLIWGLNSCDEASAPPSESSEITEHPKDSAGKSKITGPARIAPSDSNSIASDSSIEQNDFIDPWKEKVFFRIRVENRYGYINHLGEVVIPPVFEKLPEYFYEGLVSAMDKGRQGFINRKGEWVIKPKYNNAQEFNHGLAAVSFNRSDWGFIDTTGELVIPVSYAGTSGFLENKMAIVKKNSGIGIIDLENNWVVPPNYQAIRPLGGTFFALGDTLSGSYALFDSRSGKITDFRYDMVYPFSGGLSRVKYYAKTGYINYQGEEVIPPKYEKGFNFTQGLAGVKKAGKWGFIDKTGEMIIPGTFHRVSSFQGGLAAYAENGLWGFIDQEGNKVIPAKYNDCDKHFSEGLVPVFNQKKQGFINSSGTEVVPTIYDQVSAFKHGLARAFDKSRKKPLDHLYINTKGEVIWDPKNYSSSLANHP